MTRVRTTAFALGIAALACSSAVAQPERALLRQSELRAGWDVVREAPGDPASDPDLWGWGVREQHVRHYTRDLAGRIQVCSVEIWSFESLSQAASAHAGFRFPDWKIDRVGRLLVMVRGLVRGRGMGPKRGVFPECDAIGTRIRARAADL